MNPEERAKTAVEDWRYKLSRPFNAGQPRPLEHNEHWSLVGRVSREIRAAVEEAEARSQAQIVQLGEALELLWAEHREKCAVCVLGGECDRGAWFSETIASAPTDTVAVEKRRLEALERIQEATANWSHESDWTGISPSSAVPFGAPLPCVKECRRCQIEKALAARKEDGK